MGSAKELILGAGRSGLAMARLLRAEGAEPVLVDEKLSPASLPADLAELPFHGGPFQASWLEGAERLILSPGVPLDSPAARAARELGVPVSGELEEAFGRTGVPIVAITGTNGKSTTTTLISRLMEAQGYRAPAGGNLGRPLSELILEDPAADHYVVEVSSFQCETMSSFHPASAGLLNLSPDHLDRYPDAERYYGAKLKLFARLTRDDWIFAPDDPALLARLAACPARRLLFSLEGPVAEGIFLKRGQIVLRFDGRERKLLPAAALRLVGRHNLANVMAALAALLPHNPEPERLAYVLRQFPGLPHRMEDLGLLGPLRCYNDSKATNVAAALASLSGMSGPLLLIAGGRDKGGDFKELAAGLPQVRRVYGIGEAGPDIVAAFAPRGRVVEDMAGAVAAAREEGREGEQLVLSPACSSYDQYANFEERGDDLRRLLEEARQ